jgi:hypothetical protein
MTEHRASMNGVEDEEARRRFLERCGRFAVITPPAITLLLTAATVPRQAMASGFPGVGHGVGGNPPGTPGTHP